MREVFLLWCGILLLLAGCNAAPDVPGATATPAVEPLRSAWGDVTALGASPQSEAPALLATNDGALLAWSQVAADGRSQHVVQYPDAPAQVLNLPATHPYGYRWFVRENRDAGRQLYWLDRNQGDGDLNLFFATLGRESPQVARGVNAISEQPTRHYAIARNVDATAEILYSAENQGTLSLYANQTLVNGGVLWRSTLRDGGDYPVTVQASDGQGWLLWLEENGTALYGSPLTDRDLLAPQLLAELPLAADDHLAAFYTAADATHVYVFWQVRRADTLQMWWSSGAFPVDAGAITLREPQLLTFAVNAEATLATPYNAGTVNTVMQGSVIEAVYAVPPVSSVATPTLPVALYTADATLGLGIFRAGELVGYQSVIEGVPLLRPPSFDVSATNRLMLAWSQPRSGAPAALYLTQTQP